MAPTTYTCLGGLALLTGLAACSRPDPAMEQRVERGGASDGVASIATSATATPSETGRPEPVASPPAVQHLAPPSPRAAACNRRRHLPPNDEGKAFFGRRMIRDDARCLSFQETDPDSLPDPLRRLNQCWRDHRWNGCADTLVPVFARTWATISDDDSTAWLRFSEGMMLLEHGRYGESARSLLTAAALTDDAQFRYAAEHRALFAYLRDHDVEAALEVLDTLLASGVVAGDWRFPYTTYPTGFCEAAEEYCIGPPRVDAIAERRPLLIRRRDLRRAFDSLSHTTDSVQVVRTALALAEVHSAWCLSQSMYAVVCPEAAELYRHVYERFPRVEGADIAALKVHESRFSYEYEGELRWWAADALPIYRDFLEAYPTTTLTTDVCPRLLEAVTVLSVDADAATLARIDSAAAAIAICR